jgi:hypothetical protein
MTYSSGNSFDIKRKIFEVLKSEPQKRMIARDIARRIEEMFPEDCEIKKRNARVDFSNYTFQDQLVAEIGSCRKPLFRKYANLQTIETRPRQYFYSEESEDAELQSNTLVSAETKKKLSEHDLYPYLGNYLWNSLDIYSMRIDELRSRNSRGAGGNRWLFPDIVGMTDLTTSWERISVEAAKASGVERASLFSFEVKLKLNRSNVREAFFQTVSNSSWANSSYLVASEITEDAMNELRLLSGAHGIGFILLNSDDPSESQILVPVKERLQADWNLLNRLASENSDAKKFVKSIRDFHLTGETQKSNWDLVPKL